MRMKTTLLSFPFFLALAIGYVQSNVENCYKEDKHDRRFSISPGNYDPLQMTIITCTTACGELNQKYAALTYGKFCFCGNNDPDDAKKTTSGCTTPCSGDSNQMCGDSEHISVYKSAQHFTDLTLSVKSHNNFQVIFEAMAEPESIVVDYQMDYGEGNSRTQKNASDLFTKHYVLPGNFAATLYASGRNNTAPEVQASTLVSVNFPVTNMSVNCPKVTASHEEMECLVTVVDGSSLIVTSDMGDGQGPQNYTIADATRFVAGPEIPSTSTAQGTVNDGFYIMPSAEFQWEGVTVAWEIFATKAGTINLLILKPDCSNEYCYTSRTCGTCHPGMAYKCSQQLFNTATGMCGNSTAPRYTGSSLLVTYSIVDKIDSVSLSQGYNYYKLDIPTQSKEVKPGYIIAFEKLPGGAEIAQTSSISDFKSTNSATMGSKVTSATKESFGHLVRAVASRKSVLSLVHTYKTTGEKAVSFRITTSSGTSTPVQFTENISVQLGIDKIWIEANRYQKTNDDVSFEIHEHTGQNVTYEWNFGDGDVVNITSRQITHKYVKPGFFNITVRAWNQLSMKENFTEIIAEEVIKGLNLTGEPVATTDPASFWLDRSSGSDFGCELSFGDKSPPESLNTAAFPVGGIEKVHKYKEQGTYNAILTCYNNVSQDSVQLKQVVVDPITDLKMVEEGILEGENKHLNFSIDTGSMASFILTLDGTQVDIDYNEKTKKGSTVKKFEWSQLGVHKIVLTGSNAISNITIMIDFVVELEIKDAEMVVVNNKNKIKVDESVTYEVTMQGGTGVHIDWIFGDGQNHSVANPDSVEWTPGKKEVKTHTFHLAGEYDVQVIVYNKQKKIEFTHKLVVLAPIENLTIESDSPVKYTPPGLVSLVFKQSQGQKPAGALMNITYGDGKSDINLPFDLSSIYQHTYDEISVYTVKANVANELSGVTLTTTVNVVEPIEGISIKPDPPHAAFDEPVEVSVYMYRGGTADVTITWDFGDGHVEKTKRTGVSPDIPDKKSHTYKTVQNYTITISAENPLGVVNQTYEIACQHPVLTATMTSNAPAQFYENSSSRIEASMKYIGTQPTDAMMYWDDGTGDATSKKSMKPFKSKDDVSLVYHKPGNFEGKLVIYNLASKKEFTFNAGVFKKITQVDVLVKYTPRLPLNSPDKSSSQNLLPFDRPIRFHVTSDGTVVEYEAVLMKDGKTYYCNSTNSPFTCEFPEPGKYDVNITAKNNLPSAASQIVTVEVANRLTDMIVKNPTKSRLNEQVNITLTLPTMGNKTCVSVDFGDGSPIEYYGSDVGCSLLKLDTIVLAGKADKTMKLEHNFAVAGTYNIQFLAIDGFGQFHQEKPIVVSDVACKPPNITIRDASTDFEKPVIMKRHKQIRILTKTKITCSHTRDNVKQWAIYTVNPLTGEETGEVIDISKNPSAITSELALRPRFLALGLYKVTYTVTMDQSKFPNKEIFRSTAFTYVEVQKPDLVGIMVRGGSSEILWGHNTTLMLAPANYSYDPSIPRNDDQGFTNFTWFCKRSGQQYDMNTKTGPAGAEFSDKGGCFGLGPGKIEFSKGIISFSTQWMQINETYDIMVIIQKDIRKVNVSISVNIVEGIPGTAVITCSPGLCSQISSGQLVNPSARLGLSAECTDGCTSPDRELKYQWELYYFQYRWNWRLVENITAYTKGHKTKYLAVMTNIFKDFYPATKFRAKVIIIDEKAVTRAEAAMNFIVNQAPINGSCSITPKEGRTGQDFFNLTCSNWSDDQKVAEYMFYAKFKENTLTKQISFGPESDIQVYMPLGPEYDNFTMEVMAKIFDSYGAYATVSLGEVRVLPMSSEKLDALLQDLTTGSVDMIEDAMANGDLQETNTVFSTMASALNSATMYANKSERTPTGYGKDYEYRVPEEIVQMSEADYQAEQANKFDSPVEQQRNLRAKGRAKMAEALNTVTVSTISGIQLTASTLSTVCKYTEECGRDAQKAVSQNIVKMSDTLKNLGSETPREELSVAGESLLAVIGETLEATNYHIKDPLIEDMENVADTMVYDTDLDSSQGSISSGDPAKGINELKYLANKEQQTKEALKESKKIMGSMGAVTKTLSSSLVPGEDPMNMVTPKMAVSIAKSSANDLSNKKMGEGRGGFKLPDWCSMKGGNCDPDEVVALEVMATPGNIFSFAENKAVSDSSGTMSINYMSNDQSDISISGTKEPIEIVIPRDQTFKAPPPTEIQPVLLYNETLFFHTFWANNTNSSLHIEIKPNNASAQLLVFVRMNMLPNITTGNWDHVQMVPTSMEMAENYTDGEWPNPYMVFVSDEVVGNQTGKVYVGVRQLEADEIDMYYPNSTIPNFEPKTGNFTTNYTLRTFTSGCLYFKESVSDWVTDGCHVGSDTDIMRTQCFCNHMTAFSAGLMVAPNAIDWDRVLNNASFAENPTLYITQIVILVVYIGFAAWSRWQDKKDVEKLGLTPLKCNDANSKYYYEIMVVTGMRKDAGTTSKAHFILSGEYDETEVRTLSDDKRKILQRGSEDGFLMAVPRPLGALSYARIWHDNSGKGKFGSWYLKHFLVRDVQTGQKFHFVVNRWFAVEEDDGQIDRIIPVAGKEQLMNFSHMFSKRARKNLGDGHLWFSVVGRPPGSAFTRVQRVSCCLCLLFTSMFANALYYGKESGGGGGLSFGPFSVSIETISMGFVSNLIVLPVNLLIVTLFRKSKPRKEKPSRIEQALKESAEAGGAASVNDVKPMVIGGWDEITKSSTNLLNAENGADQSRPGTCMSRPRTPVVRKGGADDDKKKKKKFMFPWWCVIISWIILWLTVAGCCAGVTFYGITFGNEKCTKWISSMLISFFSSVFITEPIKVFGMAILLSLILKNPAEEDEGEEEDETVEMGDDEEFLHTNDGFGAARPRKSAYKPPDPERLERMRAQRLKEIKMWEVIKEVIVYTFFLWILMVISYRNRSPWAYRTKYALEKQLVETDNDFSSIENTRGFWEWAKNDLVSTLRAGKYYNGDPPLMLRGFMEDKVSRMMGYAVMRQLRATPEKCKMAKILKPLGLECHKKYSILNQDEGVYGQKWKELYINDTFSNMADEYKYMDSKELDGYPYYGKMAVYGGGGYVVKLKGSQKKLHETMVRLQNENWIDKMTRAVFIEFTIYNPQVNLFTVCTMLSEFTGAGSIITSYRFEPCMLLPYMTQAALFQILCEIVFVAFLIYFIVKEVKSLIKLRKNYVKEFWNLVELGIVSLSIGGMFIFMYKTFETNHLTEMFKKTQGNEYMKFQYVALWNQLFTYIVGWVVFLATLKFMKLLRFNKRMSLLSTTLRESAPGLLNFSLVFWIFFLAFVQVFYLLYFKQLQEFSNFVTGAETGFLMMMGQFDFERMKRIQPIIFPIVFSLFVVTITFILINMFLSILNETFATVREDLDKQSNDYEIVDFMVGRFKTWTGIGASSVSPEDMSKKPKPGDSDNPEGQIENFPDKVDKLLNSISQVYMEKDTLEAFFDDRNEAGKMALKKIFKQQGQTNNAYQKSPNGDYGLPKVQN